MPIVGGHTNLRTDRGQLSVAILGRAKRLLTSFDAKPGDRLVAAIDLRGRYREPFSNWEAATDAPPARLRGDLELLPAIAEAGLALAGEGHQPGRDHRHGADARGMLRRRHHDRRRRHSRSPTDVPLERWLLTFPSFGYLLSVCARERCRGASARFRERDIAAAAIGTVTADRRVAITDGEPRETIWDFASEPLIGCAPASLMKHALA